MGSILGYAALGGGIGSLFGGGGGGKSETVAPTKTSTLTAPQMTLLNSLANQIYAQMGQGGAIMPSSLGPAGYSALQNQAFQQAAQLPQTSELTYNQVFDPNAINQAMAPVGAFAQNQFQQQTIPSIMAGLGGEGMAQSSGAADILAREGRNMNLGLAAQFAPLQYSAQQAALERQFQVPTQQAAIAGQMANLGSLQRSIPQEQQAFLQNQWNQGQVWNNPALQYLAPALGSSAYAITPTEKYRTPSMLESLLPAMGQLGGSIFGAAGQAGGFSRLFS